MKRLAILVLFDPEGIVDDYVIYLLNETKKIAAKILVVSNGMLSAVGRDKIREIQVDYIERENEGFDMEAWKVGLLSYKEKMDEYDELILMNDSFYGPIYPWEEVFSKMEADRTIDFWGLTVHGKTDDVLGLCPYGYIPEHLQTYFLVIRAKMLHARVFKEYWENKNTAKSFEEAVLQHEVCFTKYFSDMGFKWSVYCDTREWEHDYDKKINHYLLSQRKLIENFHYPVLKRKALTQGRGYFLEENYGDEPKRSLTFIKDKTDYNTTLIWQHLLRTNNITAIKEGLGLNYILSSDDVFDDSKIGLVKIALIIHLYYRDLIEECIGYVRNLPDYVDVYITTDTSEKMGIIASFTKMITNVKDIRLVDGRGRDLAALLVGCNDVMNKYDILGFIHDKKSKRMGQSIAVGSAYFHALWDNMLCDRNYIRNIFKTFIENPCLGFLTPPPPCHGEYKKFQGEFWTICFDKTLELAKKLRIESSHIKLEYPPIALGSVFWCRTKALSDVFGYEWAITDFPQEPLGDDGTISHAMERIFPFAAQNQGYYSGWLMHVDFAANEIENIKCVIQGAPFRRRLINYVKKNIPHTLYPVVGIMWKLVKSVIMVVRRI
ncbi:rhamnan synthesis F family protein [Selenomonas ruminantium]|uniref:rhamnan synthesis F family protein n=1 Tax=Selenomonas ruminantium TaxID=971 RepID=UPI00047D2AC0|nr:rhamnan synthesis F family protein [Selenomonas ruminantium]